jgi:hypothetical protein
MPLRFHGAGTAFTGVSAKEVLSTVVTPSSILSKLNWVSSNVANPQIAYLLRVDSSPSGTVPSSKCATCQTVGEVASCVAIVPYGRYCFTSPTISPEEFMQRVNQGEVDFEIIGELLSPEVRELIGRGEVNNQVVTESGIALAMLAVARALYLRLHEDIWSGDPTGGTEGFREIVGLDALITNTITDALTGTPCPNLGSVVVNFSDNYNATDSTGSVLARRLLEVMTVLRHRAAAYGFGDVQWVIAVPPELKYLLSLTWAGMFSAVFGYTFPTGHMPTIDLAALARERDRMLSEDTIAIGGRVYPFIGDDGIPVTEAAGTSTGNIYIIPISAGGRKLTFLNYLDMSGSPELAQGYAAAVVTDTGRVLWYTAPSGGLCYNLTGVIVPRVVLLTPYLAAKITGISWPTMAIGFPEPLMSGGVTSRP